MTQQNDGGPAFPKACPGNHPRETPCVDWHSEQGGMSLRDWFAGMALAGGNYMEDQAYSVADAMLVARAAGGGLAWPAYAPTAGPT